MSDIINSKDLRYEPYRQDRGEDGFSGKLLMAAEVNNPEKKYIIKAGMAHVAACEFMFYKLAVKLGLPVARVRFVAPAKRGEFEFPACAVDYIPNAVMLSYKEFMEIADCEILSNLSYILGDRDNLDFLRDENGAVFKIDHSDCFGIEGTAETWINPKTPTMSYMFYQMKKTIPDITCYAEVEILQDTLDKIAGFKIDDFKEDFALIGKFCGEPFEQHFIHYIGALIEQCKWDDVD